MCQWYVRADDLSVLHMRPRVKRKARDTFESGGWGGNTSGVTITAKVLGGYRLLLLKPPEVMSRAANVAKTLAKSKTPARLYVYETLLQRLASHLQDVAAALGQFIQEQHAIVCQRHLARHRHLTPADQPHVGDRVMRGTARADRDEGGAGAGEAGDAVDAGWSRGLRAGSCRGGPSSGAGPASMSPPRAALGAGDCGHNACLPFSLSAASAGKRSLWPAISPGGARCFRGFRQENQHKAGSMDHLIRRGEERWGHREPKGPGGLKVDHQLDLHCLLDQQVSRLSPLQHLIHICGSTPPYLRKAHSVANASAKVSGPGTSTGGGRTPW